MLLALAFISDLQFLAYICLGFVFCCRNCVNVSTFWPISSSCSKATALKIHWTVWKLNSLSALLSVLEIKKQEARNHGRSFR